MNGADNLRSILPHLRPRSAEPTLFSQTVWYLLWVGVAVLVALYIRHRLRLRRQRLAEFRAAGLEEGLTEKQVELLFRVARERRMQSPVRLLRSAQAFDRQVGAVAARLARRDRAHPRLDALGRIRTALGFDDLPPDQALVSTRQIDRGQTLMVQDKGDEDAYIPWLVLHRDEGTLTLAPVLREGAAAEAAHRHRPGDELSIRFWREGDTEYSFVTHVIAAVDEGAALDVDHARVQRLQQRDFYRIDVDFPIDFRVLTGFDGDDLGAVGEVAAVDLLSVDTGDERPPAAASVPAADADPFTGQDPSLETALRISGRVVNLSAGGLAVEMAAPVPEASEGSVWIVDPAFEGPFPMAGVRCLPVGTEPAAAGDVRIKLRFEPLPPPVEKEIVRSVYEHQLQTAAGRAPEAPEMPAAVAPGDGNDDLPPA